MIEPDCFQMTADGSHVGRVIAGVGHALAGASIRVCSADSADLCAHPNPQFCSVLHQWSVEIPAVSLSLAPVISLPAPTRQTS